MIPGLGVVFMSFHFLLSKHWFPVTPRQASYELVSPCLKSKACRELQRLGKIAGHHFTWPENLFTTTDKVFLVWRIILCITFSFATLNIVVLWVENYTQVVPLSLIKET